MCWKARDGEGHAVPSWSGTGDLSPEKAPFVRVLAEFENGLGGQGPKSRSEQNLEEGWKAPRRGVGPREAHRALPSASDPDCFL